MLRRLPFGIARKPDVNASLVGNAARKCSMISVKPTPITLSSGVMPAPPPSPMAGCSVGRTIARGSAHESPEEQLGKADRIPERRLIRRSSFVITGSTGECFFPAISHYCSNGYLINCTDALEIIIGLTGECKLRNLRKMESLDNCTDAQFEHRRSNRC